jgi:hypothetical protein
MVMSIDLSLAVAAVDDVDTIDLVGAPVNRSMYLLTLLLIDRSISAVV